jgi:hypothetical protein
VATTLQLKTSSEKRYSMNIIIPGIASWTSTQDTTSQQTNNIFFPGPRPAAYAKGHRTFDAREMSGKKMHELALLGVRGGGVRVNDTERSPCSTAPLLCVLTIDDDAANLNFPRKTRADMATHFFVFCVVLWKFAASHFFIVNTIYLGWINKNARSLKNNNKRRRICLSLHHFYFGHPVVLNCI